VRRAAVVIAALAAASCGELPQDGAKPYAGKADTQPHAGDLYKGDKARYERTLAERAGFQDEYPRTGGAKTR
jgi:hypothetical protein